MGYQALLFCPDEKTARTVTQVLSELDFTVIPCTEPFGAVKKLMAERFDAVVVDCDNEQNATLLFKSARNTAENQSSLAVAVVEGQSGVAKAFRIGANLVLTKPINVEQAKGTLRVARGLLRKGEASKSAPAAVGAPPKSAAPKPAIAQVPAAAARVPQAPVSAPNQPPPQTSAPAFMTAKAPSGSASNSAAAKLDASLASETVESDDILDVIEETPVAPAARPTPVLAPKITSSSATESKAKASFVSPHFPGFSSTAASAPAPAREPAPGISTGRKSVPEISEPDPPFEETAADKSKTAAAPGPFTFAGNVSEVKPSTSGSKKVLIAIAAVVLIAIAGYAAWTQSGISAIGVNSAPINRPAPTPVLPAAPSAGAATASNPSAAAGSTQKSATSADSSSQSTLSANTSTDAPSFAKAAGAPISRNTTASATNPTANTSPDAEPSKPAAPIANKTVDSTAPIKLKKGTGNELVNDAAPPALASIVSPDSSALPSLIAQSNAPTPVLQTVNISQGVSQGLILKKVQPAYSANALRLRLEGPVQLLATISKSGNVSAVKVVSGDRQLANSAMDAVKQWKYKPYLLNGSPVEVQTQITVNFKLPR